MEQKQNSRSTKHVVDATRRGNPSAAEGGMPSEGEGGGIGSSYSATLVERPLKTGGNNQSVSRPSANTGVISTLGQGVRKTGRI
jgi:hypothetical protein